MFHNWKDAAVVLVLLAVPICNVIAWVRWTRSRKTVTQPGWREKIGLAGLVANSLAIAMPFGVFAYQFSLTVFRLTFPMIDWLAILPPFFACSLISFIASFMAPNRFRFPLILASLFVVVFVLSIPIGIL